LLPLEFVLPLAPAFAPVLLVEALPDASVDPLVLLPTLPELLVSGLVLVEPVVPAVPPVVLEPDVPIVSEDDPVELVPVELGVLLDGCVFCMLPLELVLELPLWSVALPVPMLDPA
jgi:hypothetical protein